MAAGDDDVLTPVALETTDYVESTSECLLLRRNRLADGTICHRMRVTWQHIRRDLQFALFRDGPQLSRIEEILLLLPPEECERGPAARPDHPREFVDPGRLILERNVSEHRVRVRDIHGCGCQGGDWRARGMLVVVDVPEILPAPGERLGVHVSGDDPGEPAIGGVPQQPADTTPKFHHGGTLTCWPHAIPGISRDGLGQRVDDGEQVTRAGSQEDRGICLVGRVHATDDAGVRNRPRITATQRSVGNERVDEARKVAAPTL